MANSGEVQKRTIGLMHIWEFTHRGRTTRAQRVLFPRNNLTAHLLTDAEAKKRLASMYIRGQAAKTESSSNNLIGYIHKRTREEWCVDWLKHWFE